MTSATSVERTSDWYVWRKKVTQTDLAARLQVRSVQLNQNSICRIEKGRSVVTDYELLIIADALDVSVTDLLMRSESSTWKSPLYIWQQQIIACQSTWGALSTNRNIYPALYVNIQYRHNYSGFRRDDSPTEATAYITPKSFRFLLLRSSHRY